MDEGFPTALLVEKDDPTILPAWAAAVGFCPEDGEEDDEEVTLGSIRDPIP